MAINTSRIVTMDRKIYQAQVNNPQILELTPLLPNQVQVSAKATGITKLNVWDENKRLFTVEVFVRGDATELDLLLRSCFPARCSG